MASVHVAGSFENKEICKRVMRSLQQNGHSIVYDWTALDTAKQLDSHRITEEDFHRAEVMVAVMPAGRSTHVEIGLSIAQGRPVILFAPTESCLQNPKDGRVCSYYSHMAVKTTTHEEEVEQLVRWQAQRAGY